MKGKSYTKELKEEILREVQEVGNVPLVSRKHRISKSTIFAWIKIIKRYAMSKLKSLLWNSLKVMLLTMDIEK